MAATTCSPSRSIRRIVSPPGYSGAEERGSGAGFGFNINLPLLPGGGHASYVYAMERLVIPAIERFRPQLIVDGRLVVVHEGGYAESYVPFCAHAVLETLAGVRTEVEDPVLDMFHAWQPNARFEALQRELLDELVVLHGLAG